MAELADATVLVVDDDRKLVEILEKHLGRLGYQVVTALGGAEALALLDAGTRVDVTLSDVQMKGLDGRSLMAEIRRRSPDNRVILMTAFGAVSEAVEAMREGAFWYLTKPFKIEEAALVLRRAVAETEMGRRIVQLERSLRSEYRAERYLGRSELAQAVRGDLTRAAELRTAVLLLGKTGTGKELAARAIHYQSARRDRPFIPVNCGAIPDSLIESELFGHRKGAFTDAKDNQPGLVTLAEGGTLFLDEIDALSPKGQVTLLRFLQDQEFRPLGARNVEHGNVRVLAASNASLTAMAEEGSFRADLLYRLRILCLDLAPLRERSGDVTHLAEWFLHACEKRYGLGTKVLHPETLAWMGQYRWPGNIRELENLLYREYLLSEGEVIRIEAPKGLDPPASGRAEAPPGDLNFNRAKARALESFERDYLRRLLVMTDGNISLAAKLAGKERRSLGKLIKKLGLGQVAPRDASRLVRGIRA